MSRAESTNPLIQRRALLILAVTFVSYAYFYEGGGWNQNSRFDLVRAIVEQGTLRIDAYHENTQDKSFYQGHYYSDKAPGLVLLALPAAAIARPLLRATGIDPMSPRGLVAISYLVTVFAVALPTALACACLFWIAVRLGSSETGAAFAALSMGLATPIWAYATLFWGHALTGASLLFAFAAGMMLRSCELARRDFLCGVAVGLGAGWATVSEYPAAPAAVILAVFALAQVWQAGWPRRWPTAAGIFGGALACIAVLMVYQYHAFGSALHPSYAYYQEGAFPWMKHGYMGLTYPRIDVMLKLLFGCRRGLFVVSPILVAAPFGLRALWKNPATRGAAAAASGVAAYYFLFNASFWVWDGGWSYGPRYLSAGLPLLCVGLAPAWSSANRCWRRILAALALCGGLFSLMAVSTTAQPPDRFRCALFQLLAPSFWAGKLSLNQGGSMLTLSETAGGQAHGAFNLGELAGLHGLPSLIPLFVVWALAAFLWSRMNHAERRAANH
jgi:hypothetical protein